MSATPRKRQLSEANYTNNKTLKLDQNSKENIPPDFSGVINAHETNVNVHEILTKITTPKKSRGSLKELPVTPSANVKLLATVAADCEYAETTVISTLNKNDEIYDQISCDSDSLEMSSTKVNRKEKSLAVICTRFLGIYPEYPPPNKSIIISLDEVCLKLGVERRRLYDIVNVLESIDIVAKNAKNQYLWFGKNNLVKSLCKLQAAAIAEKMLDKLQYVLNTEDGNCKQSCILNEVQNFNKTLENPYSLVPFSPSILSPSSNSSADTRREKSLGVMSQKFLMLFLISPNKVISLGVAAKVLNGFLQRNERPALIKTQVRRLYDVANVLSSIGLIQKENTVSQCIRKPAFRYIGPDLENLNDNNTDCVRKFQQIVEVAELEHKKLNLKESHESSSSTESGSINAKDCVNTYFHNLQSNKDSSSTCPVENKSTVTIPIIMQPSLKVINNKSSEINPTIPCYILNNVPTDRMEVKNSSIYGTSTFFVLNPIVSSKQVKAEPSQVQQNNKVSNQQIIALSSEQRDAILQSLNISLSSQQIASIHLDGASESNSQGMPCNVLKIINKTQSNKVSKEKNSMKISTPKDFESNSINNTRSNTPTSSGTAGSPLSIPSGYVTPIPNASSDIPFISNKEVQDILKNIENHSKLENPINKISISKLENQEDCTEKVNSAKIKKNTAMSHETLKVENKQMASSSLNIISKNEINSCINQANQLMSNDSCSNDSLSQEISNILKNKNSNDTLIKSKPFLIDEKTLLSPIKAPKTPVHILVPSTLISPPHIVPENIFVFNAPSTSYQTTKMNNNPNIVKVIPNILTRLKKQSIYQTKQ